MSYAKWRQLGLGLNVLTIGYIVGTFMLVLSSILLVLYFSSANATISKIVQLIIAFYTIIL